MSRKAKAKIDFIDDSMAAKIEKSRLKSAKIADAAATFVTPDLALGTFNTNIDTFETLYQAVEGGDHSKIAARDAAEVVLDNNLRTLAAYVSRIANGSESIIVLGGFTPTKTDIPKSQIPAQPAMNGQTGKVMGELELSVGAVQFAIRYTFIVGEDLSHVAVVNGCVVVTTTNQTVYVKTTNLNKVTFTNLLTRVNFQCMCFATSTVGGGLPCDVIVVKSA